MTDAGGTLVASVVLDSAAGYEQIIRAGHHELRADEPKSAGGSDGGPSPFALLLSAVGACTAITLRMYAERKAWELGAIHVTLQLLRDGSDQRIEREIRLAAALSDEQVARLAEIADKTPVTRVVREGVLISTRVLVGSDA
jgi:putative redox protein